MYVGIFLIVAILAVIGRCMPLSANESSEVVGALRLQKSVGAMGWVLAAAGTLAALASFAVRSDVRIPILLGGITGAVLGALILVQYRNWYVLVLKDEVVHRTATKKIKRIPYDSVKSYDLLRNGGITTLRMCGNDGTKIYTNSKILDVHSVIQKMLFSQQSSQRSHPTGAPYPQAPRYLGPDASANN